MAKSRRTISRTVRFFEIVDHRMMAPLDEDMPWDDALVRLTAADIEPEDRTVPIGGDDHHGGGWMGTPNMLLFSRIRQGIDVPEVFDRADGTLQSLELAETQGVAETTHVAFFPYNIVGMIRTQSSPGATSLGTWINRMGLIEALEGRAVDVRPLSRVNVTTRVQDIDRAQGVQIRSRTTASARLAEGGASRMADVLDNVERQFGPVTVEMRIYVKEDQGTVDVRNTILEEAQDLIRLTASGEAIEGVEAATLSYVSLESEKVAEINMMKDKLAQRVDVEVIDDDGRATRRASAAAAIQRAYTHLEGDLVAAVQRDRD